MAVNPSKIRPASRPASRRAGRTTHDLVHLGEAVDTGGRRPVAPSPTAARHWTTTTDAVRSFGQQGQRLTHGGVRGDGHGVSKVGWEAFTFATVAATTSGCPAAGSPSRRAGPPSRIRAAGDRGHVGHHQRQGGADPVGARQVHVQPGAHSRAAGDHEDVGVGEVVWRVRGQSHVLILPRSARQVDTYADACDARSIQRCIQPRHQLHLRPDHRRRP